MSDWKPKTSSFDYYSSGLSKVDNALNDAVYLLGVVARQPEVSRGYYFNRWALSVTRLLLDAGHEGALRSLRESIGHADEREKACELV